MGLHDHLNKITDGLKGMELDAPDSGAVKKGRGGMPATSSLAHFSDELRESSAELAELRRNAGQALVVSLDLLDEGSFHCSPLDPARVTELVGQLRVNPQSTPMLLRRKADGRFEIIAGRHRKAALLVLGRTVGDAVIKELDDDTAERLTFFDNLFARQLPDYEKFLGFAQRKRSKSLTQEQLAAEAGVSSQWVSKLLSFEALPEQAHELLRANPAAVGAYVAVQLVQLAKTEPSRTVECIGLLISGKLKSTAVATWLSGPNRAGPVRLAATKIKRGKKAYAEFTRRSSQVTVRFSADSEAQRFEAELSSLLKRLASDVA